VVSEVGTSREGHFPAMANQGRGGNIDIPPRLTQAGKVLFGRRRERILLCCLCCPAKAATVGAGWFVLRILADPSSEGTNDLLLL
jgi:hypothetical protein